MLRYHKITLTTNTYSHQSLEPIKDLNKGHSTAQVTDTHHHPLFCCFHWLAVTRAINECWLDQSGDMDKIRPYGNISCFYNIGLAGLFSESTCHK